MARLDQFRPGTRATQGSMSEVSGHGWPAALPKHQGWVDKISQSRHSWWAREKARSPVGVSRDYNEYNVKHDLPTRETPTPDKMQNERVDAGGKWAALAPIRVPFRLAGERPAGTKWNAKTKSFV